MSKEEKKSVQAMIDEMASIWTNRTGKTSVNRVSVVNQPTERACYRPNSSSIETYSTGYRVIAHEFGHHVEHSDTKAYKACQKFLDSRTQGKTPQSLPKYDESEKFKKDHFVDEYVGKVYAHDATEVLSMGLERIMVNPAKFMREDREHFELILDILRGTL